jgi:predicted nucleotide-binding protein (sugar kinase/HSP70/actin superfamily)
MYSDNQVQFEISDELERFAREEGARLGLDGVPKAQWRDSMINPMFTKQQRPTTTMLHGGLTMAHDHFVEGALRGLGYNVRALDCPDLNSLRFGKEFGNRGQCNPTHFTVGNLVKELVRLRDEEGIPAATIVERYVFMTAGACGPCRFGMYVTEYRKALRDAGFDGFRVLLFQQAGGIQQATGEELGLDLGPAFFFAIAKALFIGDVLNLMAYRMRPYEVKPGATDQAVVRAKRHIHSALSENSNLLVALWFARKELESVELDRLRSRPKVSILGEFWAMTTEGDGNYHLQRFIEQEGGECDIQTIINVVLYNVWEKRHDTTVRLALREADSAKFGLAGSDPYLTLAGLWLGDKALRLTWQTFAKMLGLYAHTLPDMDEVARVGHSHYNVELRGGEGHLEVAKLILNVVKQKTHMTVSVKPFGCMPSSGVSDGVQSAITELYPQAIFCPVETSGDGAVNFQSRVQMYLFKARQRAEAELQAALDEHGVTLDEVRAFIAGTRFARGTFRAPHVVAGSAADLVHHVGPLVKAGRIGRLRIHATRAVRNTRAGAVLFGKRVHGLGLDLREHLPPLARAAAEAAWGNAAPLAERAREATNKFAHKFIERVEVPEAAAPPPERQLPVLGQNSARTPAARRAALEQVSSPL